MKNFLSLILISILAIFLSSSAAAANLVIRKGRASVTLKYARKTMNVYRGTSGNSFKYFHKGMRKIQEIDIESKGQFVETFSNIANKFFRIEVLESDIEEIHTLLKLKGFTSISKKTADVIETQPTLTLYFRTNSWTIRRNSLKKIVNFAKKYKSENFIIEGYADVRGDIQSNYDLGLKRAYGVETIIERNADVFSSINVISHGESKSSNKRRSMRFDRKVVIKIHENPVSSIIKKIENITPPPIWLIDASGSMENYWSDVSQYKKDEEMYVIYNGDLQVMNSINNISCDGGTPLFDSIVEIASSRKNFELAVLTDGLENQSSSSSSNLIDICKTNNIKITVVSLGWTIPENILEIVKQTGGQYSVLQN